MIAFQGPAPHRPWGRSRSHGGFPLVRSRVAVFRYREAQVAAEGGGLVLGTDDAALLEDRDHLLAEAAPLAGVADADVEAVEGAGLEPRLDLVRDRGRGAGERG